MNQFESAQTLRLQDKRIVKYHRKSGKSFVILPNEIDDH